MGRTEGERHSSSKRRGIERRGQREPFDAHVNEHVRDPAQLHLHCPRRPSANLSRTLGLDLPGHEQNQHSAVPQHRSKKSRRRARATHPRPPSAGARARAVASTCTGSTIISGISIRSRTTASASLESRILIPLIFTITWPYTRRSLHEYLGTTTS